jgi:hypothetical protein
MGYLNNSTITVDAILTKKGREILARGTDQFRITQFALADDEIDYDLYNPDHPLGTAFYGAAIENLPMTEALTDEAQMMKYKLITLPRGSNRLPFVDLGVPSINGASGQTFTISPITANLPGSDDGGLGYTAIIADSSLVVGTGQGFGAAQTPNATVASFIGDAGTSVQIQGVTFNFSLRHPDAGNQAAAPRQTSITFIGNATGGQATLPITIRPTL